MSMKPSQMPRIAEAQGKSFARSLSEKFSSGSVTSTTASTINRRQAELQAASKN